MSDESVNLDNSVGIGWYEEVTFIYLHFIGARVANWQLELP